jgi:hypothetical protein
MSGNQPGSEQNAAYASFALVEGLTELLIRKGLLTSGEVKTMLATAFERLQAAPNGPSKRAADFVTTLKFDV